MPELITQSPILPELAVIVPVRSTSVAVRLPPELTANFPEEVDIDVAVRAQVMESPPPKGAEKIGDVPEEG